ncbi:hypothetical protein PACTADRAFT_50537 [Pachysolen tannophilus NRRL Y-2460]|uniref:Uncharacterized protein n=1 Tax=Pachysolen tannophilus NRRL Y-2460 TaxID=669874 RepID=A0A1E4TSG2_PACTA|nr:hypothetical protein PACTADRAFT_50537 [Pachysolen tannophilus NRRL Y-2460]
MDNPIANFEIRKIERLIITENMLIFDVNCMAKNYNLQDVSIDGSDLDIFIQTSHYDDPDDSESSLNKALSAKPKLEKTILLGNVKEFFVPLQFPGLMNNKNYGSPINNPNLDHHISTEGLGDLWHNLFHKDEIKPTVSIGQIKLTEFKLNLDPIISENFKLLIRGSFKYKLRGHNRLISVSKSLQVDKSKA